jgi:hypothetical protein
MTVLRHKRRRKENSKNHWLEGAGGVPLAGAAITG